MDKINVKAQSSNFLLTFILSPQRLCRNEGDAMFVILNEVKNLIESTS